MNLFSLEGKTAIITGATGLLGKEHTKALFEAGANVVITDLEQSKCDNFAREFGSKALAYACDITKKESVECLLNETIKSFGKVDILVNNASINDMFENPISALEESKFENYSLEQFRKILEVNILGMFICSQVIGKEMFKHKNGSIINIASTYGIVAPDQSLYTDKEGKQIFYKSVAYPTTKHAVIGFTRFLAAYWGSSGIRVNAISPGGVYNNQDPYFVQKYSEKTPLKRMANPNDFKGALIFLASDASKYVTGANIVVDGGWTIW